MSNILDHILDKFKIYLHILHFQFSVFLVKSRDQHLTQKRIGAGSTRSLKKRGLWLREVADEEKEGNLCRGQQISDIEPTKLSTPEPSSAEEQNDSQDTVQY